METHSESAQGPKIGVLLLAPLVGAAVTAILRKWAFSLTKFWGRQIMYLYRMTVEYPMLRYLACFAFLALAAYAIVLAIRRERSTAWVVSGWIAAVVLTNLGVWMLIAFVFIDSLDLWNYLSVR